MKFLFSLLVMIPLLGSAQQNKCIEFDMQRSAIGYLWSENGKDFYCSCPDLNEMKTYDIAFVAFCQDTLVKDKEAYVRSRMGLRSDIQPDDIKKLKTIEVDGVSGIEIIIKEKDNKTKSIRYHYQVVFFKPIDDGTDMTIYVMNSIVYGDHTHNLNVLKEIARTMKMK